MLSSVTPSTSPSLLARPSVSYSTFAQKRLLWTRRKWVHRAGLISQSVLGCLRIHCPGLVCLLEASLSPSLGCREEAGETFWKRALASPAPRARRGSKGCWHSVAPFRRASVGLCSAWDDAISGNAMGAQGPAAPGQGGTAAVLHPAQGRGSAAQRADPSRRSSV